VAGFCEHGNEPSSCIKKAGYFFEKLSDSFSNNILHHGMSKYVSKTHATLFRSSFFVL
jgi:hypothetical protein